LIWSYAPPVPRSYFNCWLEPDLSGADDGGEGDGAFAGNPLAQDLFDEADKALLPAGASTPLRGMSFFVPCPLG